MENFRICSKNLSLTYPQSQLTKTIVFQGLVSRFKLYQAQIAVAEERHKESGIHFHCLVMCEKKFDARRSDCLDIEKEHGNYQACRNPRKWYLYMTKEDTAPMCTPDFALDNPTPKRHNKEIFDKLMELGPKKLLQQGDISIYNYGLVKKNWENYLKEIDIDNREEIEELIPNTWGLTLRFNTDLKRCHLWIYSEMPNCGKTTFGASIVSKYLAEFWNYNEIYQPQINKDIQAIIFDEYRGQLKVSQLNQICDGFYYFTAKGMNAWRLGSKPLVIVLSNRSIRACYKSTLDYLLVEARFQEIQVFPNMEMHEMLELNSSSILGPIQEGD